MDLNNYDTEIPKDQLEECALKLSAKDFAGRSKAKAKPQRKREPSHGKNWIDIEPGNYSFSVYEVSKKVVHLFRHFQQIQRNEDGAVHFWRIKENIQKQFPQSIHWSNDGLAAGKRVKNISVLY